MEKVHPLAFLPVSAGFLVLILSLALSVWKVTQPEGQGSQNLSTQAADVKGTLSFFPVSQTLTFDPKTNYTAGIVIHSGSRLVIGTDVLIHFDPKMVIVDSKVSAGTVFEQSPISKVNNTAGTIILGFLNFQPRIADGILATFKYKVKSIGNVRFWIDYSPGSKTDSNMVDKNQEDILANIDNAFYTFK